MIKKTFLIWPVLLVGILLHAQNEQGAAGKSPDEVYEQYEEAFLLNDLEQMMKLYAEDAVVISSDGNSYKGREQIQTIYERGFNHLPRQMAIETLYHITEGSLLYRIYAIKNEETGEQYPPFVTDTFIIENGKIRYHTFAAYYPGMEIAEAPVPLAVPEDWSSQTSILPRYFAPGVYEGIADYAFAPGMFEPKAEDYFTYVMVFWLPGDTEVDEQKLERNLENYFDGLALAAQADFTTENIEEKKLQFFDSLATRHSLPQDSLRANVALTSVGGNDKWQQSYTGKLRIYEAMAAQRQLELNTNVRLQKCAASQYRLILLEISPQPYSHEIWQQLNNMSQQLECAEN